MKLRSPRGVTAPRAAAGGVALIGLLTVPLWVGNSYYVDVASQILLFAVFAAALDFQRRG